VDGGVDPVAAHELGVSHQLLAVEDADRRRLDVIARQGPVADEVCLLDVDPTGVVLLLASDQVEERARLGLLQRPGRQAFGGAWGVQWTRVECAVAKIALSRD